MRKIYLIASTVLLVFIFIGCSFDSDKFTGVDAIEGHFTARNNEKDVHDGFFYQNRDNENGNSKLNYSNSREGRYSASWEGVPYLV